MPKMNWIPSLITSAAIVVAFSALVVIDSGDFALAAKLIMICLILDGLDGITARKLKMSTNFGAELDTFLDQLAYGVVPAFLVYTLLSPYYPALGWALAIVTVLSGSARLARFRVVDPARGEKGYLGMPITVNAGWVAMFVFMTESGFVEDPRFQLTGGFLGWGVWMISLIFLILQVSTVRYRKPTKTPLMFFAGIVAVLLLFTRVDVAFLSALLLTVYGVYYALISPWMPGQRSKVTAKRQA